MKYEYNPATIIRCSNELCGGVMVLRRNRATGAAFLSCRKCAKARPITREDIFSLERQGAGAQTVLELTEQRINELERRAATLRPIVNKAAAAGLFAYDNTHTVLKYNRETGDYEQQGRPDWEAIRLQRAWSYISSELEMLKRDAEQLRQVATPAAEIVF